MVIIERKCLNCENIITKIKPSHFERKKFCSRKCKGEYQSKNPKAFSHLKTQKNVQCCNCGKDVLRKPSVLAKAKFTACSKECWYEYQSKNKTQLFEHLRKPSVSILCKECGNPFEVIPSRKDLAKYCSKKCLGKKNGRKAKEVLTKKISIECSNCNDIFRRKPSIIRGKLNFCSEKCMGEYYSKTGMFAGENSGTWQGGDVDYYGSNWREQRRKARKRDNYTCQDCGKTEGEYGQELSVHHIKLFRDFNGDWKKANRLSNLVSLCEYPCHRNRHSKNYKPVDDIV